MTTTQRPTNQHINLATLLLAVCLAVFTGCRETPASHDSANASDTTAVAAPQLLYGLPVDSFFVEKTTVRQGQMISQILTGAGLPYAQAIAAYEKALPIYDFRQMKAGQTCCFFHSTDTASASLLLHFVYEVSPTSYVLCSFSDSISVSRHDVCITPRRRAVAATINSNLWNALSEQQIDPQVALDLSDVFAWTVDFFGLDKGDRFGIIYDERLAGDKVVGSGPITAAVYISSAGKRSYAFRHVGDSIAGYYDLQGNSLRRAFLKAPLHFSRISSRFSNGRMHPILKIRRPHHGVDYAAPKGTPVVALGDGKVIAKGYDPKGGGNYIKIRHNSVYTTVYMHLNNFSKGLTLGQQVRQGDVIGAVGATGLATGPHLDFRMYRDGQPVDPLRVEMPPAEPINNDDIIDFMDESDKLKASLDSLFNI